MKLRQIIICLSVGMLSFGMADSTFATASNVEIEAAKQGKVVTSDIARWLIKNMKDGELIIPEEYTAIEGFAFCYKRDIKKIKFKNIQTIGTHAFEYCTELEKIDFGNVQTIEDHAFYECTNLNQIDLENVQTIGNSAFRGCTKLNKIDFRNVTKIEKGAFWGCKTLEKIDFKNVQTIGMSAFCGCTGLKEIDLGNVQTIEQIAFSGCTKLNKIDFRNVQTIGKYAFSKCTSLQSITIPDSVISIIDGAFLECTNLESINVYSDRVKQLILSSDSEIDESIIHVISNDKTEHRELTMQEKYSTELKEIERLKSLLRKEKGGEEFVDIAEVKSDLHLANDEVYMKQLEKTKAQLLKKLEKKNKK